MMNRQMMMKRIVAALMLCVLLIVCVPVESLADSMYFMNQSSNGKVDVYVRIFVPTSKSPKKSIGHYDLMIKGQLHFQGKTFTDPVFSYRVDGTMDVFNAADTKLMYPHSKGEYFYGVNMYTLHMRVSGLDSVYEFLDEVGSNVKSAKTHPSNKHALKCKLKGKYAKYSVKQVNCYLAVAKWAQIFGNNDLMSYYSSAHKGNKKFYLPKTIVKKYKKKLKKVF